MPNLSNTDCDAENLVILPGLSTPLSASRVPHGVQPRRFLYTQFPVEGIEAR